MVHRDAADLSGLSNDLTKFDYRSSGRDKWRERIDGIELRQITPAKIQDWKQSFLAAAANLPRYPIHLFPGSRYDSVDCESKLLLQLFQGR